MHGQGFLYLIHDWAADMYKLGISKNPSSRWADIRVSNPSVSLIDCIKVTNMYLAERIAHQQADYYWIVGEWFDMPLVTWLRIVERLIATSLLPLRSIHGEDWAAVTTQIKRHPSCGVAKLGRFSNVPIVP